MCLGIPGEVQSLREDALRTGRVAFGGVVKEVCLAYVPEAQVGDYVVVHVGFAISLLSEEEAAKTLEMLREVSDIQAELGVEPGEVPA